MITELEDTILNIFAGFLNAPYLLPLLEMSIPTRVILKNEEKKILLFPMHFFLYINILIPFFLSPFLCLSLPLSLFYKQVSLA